MEIVTLIGMILSLTGVVILFVTKKDPPTRLCIQTMIEEHYKLKYCYKKLKEFKEKKSEIDGLKRRIIDLELKGQKPKFKKGDKVEWYVYLEPLGANRYIPKLRHNGEYLSRCIDYNKGGWVAKVLVGCEVKEVLESELTKIKK